MVCALHTCMNALIVPYGIETIVIETVDQFRNDALIVPYGIETKKSEKSWQIP